MKEKKGERGKGKRAKYSHQRRHHQGSQQSLRDALALKTMLGPGERIDLDSLLQSSLQGLDLLGKYVLL